MRLHGGGRDAERRSVRALAWWLILSVGLTTAGATFAGPGRDGTVEPAPAAAKPVYEVRRAAGEVEVDGRLDEAAWAGEPTFQLGYETRPAENGPAPVETRVWVTYDDHSLYLGFRALDPQPERIRARLTDRDSAYQDDFVGVVLDTFNDERRAFEFFANPLGVQMDMTQDELTGNEDDSWDAIWDSAGRITAEGYEVEIQIPFSSLRFPRVSGPMTWGVDCVRFYPRDQRYRVALHPLERGNNCYLCQASKLVGFEGVEPARSLELDPTLTGSVMGTRADFPDGPLEDDDPDVEPGLTARWGVTPNLVLSAAVNPDFSQVEADSAQLDVNTQFALFYPEKRPFFLEGGDLFSTRFNAIYSRNIADPQWGLKLSGKMGRNGLGVIVTRDRQTNFLIPGSQGSELASLDEGNLSTMVRYRRDLLGATTGGFFYTGREGDGFHNRLFGGDVLFRWRDTEAWRVEVLGSTSLYPALIAAEHGQSAEEISDWAIRTVYQHTSRDWMTYVLYREVGEDFRADLGFVPQADFREGGAALERAWYPSERGVSELRVGVELDEYHDHAGQRLDRRAEAYTWANGPRQSFVRFGLVSGDRFFAGEVFDTDRVTAHGEAQLLPSLYVNLDAQVGNEVDFANVRQAEQLRLDPGFRLELGRHTRLTLNHSYERLEVDEGELFTANLTQLRATYQLNVRTFVRWIGQYLDVQRNPELYKQEVDAESRSLFNQLLFSYKVNPQTVLFLGYSDTSFGDQGVDLTRESRTIFLKIGYAWLL